MINICEVNPSIGPMVPLDKLHAPISKPFELPKHGLNDDHAGQFPLSRAIFDNQHTSNLGDSRQIPNNRETSDLITELEHEAAVTASSRLKKKHKSQGRRRYTEEGGRRKEGAA